MFTPENSTAHFIAYLPLPHGEVLKAETQTLFQTPFTPITLLIDHVYRFYAKEALKILRERFITNYELSPVCRETLKVAAKRVRIDPGYTPDPSLIQSIILQPTTFSDYISTYSKIVSLNEAKNLLLQEIKTENLNGLSVYAIALSSKGEILSFQKNRSYHSKHFHAEVLLCRDYFLRHRQCFPKGTQIITSLQPCRMCAAHLIELTTDGDLKVFYLEKDTGPFSQNTLIHGLEQKI